MMRRRLLLSGLAALALAAGVAFLLTGPGEEAGRGAVPAAGAPRPAPPEPGPLPPVILDLLPDSPGAWPASAAPPDSPADPAPATVLLLVRDAATGEPLPGARVHSHVEGAECGARVFRVLPRADSPEVADLPSDSTPDAACLRAAPLGVAGPEGSLPVPRAGAEELHVVADGHAWGRPVPDPDGNCRALLAPGGGVRLRIRRWGELEEPILLACRGAGERVIEFVLPEEEPGWEPEPPEEGAAASTLEGEEGVETWDVARILPGPAPGTEVVLVEGLGVGEWTLQIRRGAPGGEVYGEGRAAVRAGAVTDLLLEVTPTLAGPRAPVTAVLSIPDGWGAGEGEFEVEVAHNAFIADPGVFVELRGLDLRNRHLLATGRATAPSPEGTWPVPLAPDLPPGRYRVSVHPPGWSAEVVVPPSPREFRLRLPDPATATLVVLDRDTGAPLAARVEWNPFGDRPRSIRAGEDGAVLLRAPAGAFRLSIDADGYRGIERTLTLVAGSPQRREIRLAPAARIRVLLREGGAPYAGSAYVHVELKLSEEEMARAFEDPEAKESGLVTGQSGGLRAGGEVTFGELTPGTVEVRVDPIPGFQPLAPRRVPVHAGRTTEVVFDLLR